MMEQRKHENAEAALGKLAFDLSADVVGMRYTITRRVSSLPDTPAMSCMGISNAWPLRCAPGARRNARTESSMSWTPSKENALLLPDYRNLARYPRPNTSIRPASSAQGRNPQPRPRLLHNLMLPITLALNTALQSQKVHSRALATYFADPQSSPKNFVAPLLHLRSRPQSGLSCYAVGMTQIPETGLRPSSILP